MVARFPVVVAGTPILVVDDNTTNRRILEDMLTNWGTEPVTASTAESAMQMLQFRHNEGKKPFQLLLTDVNMPEMDGFTLAEQIRRQPRFADLSIIMLTSSGRPGDVARRNQLNVAANLMKPVKQSELFDAIVKVLGVTAAEDVHETDPRDAAQSKSYPDTAHSAG